MTADGKQRFDHSRGIGEAGEDLGGQTAQVAASGLKRNIENGKRT
jgi:hypothetical protein